MLFLLPLQWLGQNSEAVAAPQQIPGRLPEGFAKAVGLPWLNHPFTADP
jgi:hypothetical protein